MENKEKLIEEINKKMIKKHKVKKIDYMYVSDNSEYNYIMQASYFLNNKKEYNLIIRNKTKPQFKTLVNLIVDELVDFIDLNAFVTPSVYGKNSKVWDK